MTSRRRAVMSVDCDLLADMLDLPDGVRIAGVSPGEIDGFRHNAAILRLEGGTLELVEEGCRAPYVQAVYRTQQRSKFLRFEKDRRQED